MVKTKRGFVLATCFLSGAASLISLVALGTQEWVVSDGRYTTLTGGLAKIRYGLFSGTYKDTVGVTNLFETVLTCSYSNNICALVCGSDAGSRSDMLNDLYENKKVKNINACPTLKQSASVYKDIKILKSDNSKNDGFINCGAWFSTVFFLIVSAIFGIFATGLSIWNTAANPIETYFNIFGLYIYNAVACVFVLISILTWGIMYSSSLTHNVAVFYSITGDINTDGIASLGYSYWLNLGSLLLYISSIVVLYVRHYLISTEPDNDLQQIEEPGDPGLLLF